MDFNAFLSTLPYMGRGMIGVFFVTLILMVCVEGLSRLPGARGR